MSDLNYVCKGAHTIQGAAVQYWTIKQNEVLGVVNLDDEYYAIRPIDQDAIVEAEKLAVRLGLNEVL